MPHWQNTGSTMNWAPPPCQPPRSRCLPPSLSLFGLLDLFLFRDLLRFPSLELDRLLLSSSERDRDLFPLDLDLDLDLCLCLGGDLSFLLSPYITGLRSTFLSPAPRLVLIPSLSPPADAAG